MIDLKLNGEIYSLKTKFDEITISDYQKIINIINREEDYFFESWIDIISELGTPKEYVEKLSVDNLLDIIKEFNITEIDSNLEILKTIEIDGYEYNLYDGDEFQLTIGMSNLVEKTIKNNPNNFIVPIITQLYKRTDLTTIEHNDKAHIDFKIKLFQNQTMDKFIKLFVILFEGLVTKIQKFNQ
jgi:hypothetical protein